MYHRKLAIKIIDLIIAQNNQRYNEQYVYTYFIDKPYKRWNFINRKYNKYDIFYTIKQMKLKNQLFSDEESFGGGSTVYLYTTENSYSVYENPFVTYFNNLFNNQTFAAAFGAAVGINLNQIIKEFTSLIKAIAHLV